MKQSHLELAWEFEKGPPELFSQLLCHKARLEVADLHRLEKELCPLLGYQVFLK